METTGHGLSALINQYDGLTVNPFHPVNPQLPGERLLTQAEVVHREVSLRMKLNPTCRKLSVPENDVHVSHYSCPEVTVESLCLLLSVLLCDWSWCGVNWSLELYSASSLREAFLILF